MEWEVYDELDPVGEWRSDYRAAIMLSTEVNNVRSVWGKKGARMSTPLEFFKKYFLFAEEAAGRDPQTVEEMKAVLFEIGRRYGKKK